ncbi:MAG: SDR family oxidoreductase [candidate division WOR-3 bacterium]|nr:SDR family oxidoreductase [candidate division WOR-3 bacterium]
MEISQNKVVLITGASSGIGKACAIHLAQHNYIVFGTSRKINTLTLTDQGFYLLPMDVTDNTSIQEGISFIIKDKGRIDILINNAGMGIAGPIEETGDDEALMQLNVNLIGQFRVTKAVLPYMRKQNAGLIIFISSLAAEIGLPYQAFYSASKSALNNFAEALQMECPFITVVVVEPGDYKTAFTDNRILAKGYNPKTSYYEKCQIVIEKQNEFERKGGDPKEIAELILKIIQRKRKKFYYGIGRDAKSLLILGKILPRRFLLKEVAKHYGL